MKTLVVFYSLEGNTKFVSEIIAKELDADIFELKVKKEFPSSGFKKYFWAGKSVVFKEKPVLTNTDLDLSIYENIILATPIWASKYASPFNTFIRDFKFSGKNVALLACHGGGRAKKSFKLFKKNLPDNDFMGEIDFLDPLIKDKDANAIKAEKWAKGLRF